METLGTLARWVELCASSVLLGTLLWLVAVGGPAARHVDGGSPWLDGMDARLARWLGLAVVVALIAGVVDLWRQIAVATELGPLAALAPGPILQVLGSTRFGSVWLVRHATLVLLGCLLVLTGRPQPGGVDWIVLRGQALLFAIVVVAVGAAASHAASAEASPGLGIASQAAHAVGSGAWLGALPALLLGLRLAADLPALVEEPLVASVVRRFSAFAILAVLVILMTGVVNATLQVASYPALFGTSYGRWLLGKLGLTAGLLVAGALNLLVLRPRLERIGKRRGAARRLRRSVAVEVLLGAGLLGTVAVMGLTTPARHDVIDWPFGFRLSWDAVQAVPSLTWRVAVGSQVAIVGLVAALLAALVPRPRTRLLLGLGVLAMAGGLLVALPPLAIDAYPSTYWRSPVAYSAPSIVAGGHLYARHCAPCHGLSGRGDGPAAAGLRPPPADLTAAHTGDHTAGDLFWWLTRGKPPSAMPAFGGRLGDAEIWQLISQVRTLAAAPRVATLTPAVAPLASASVVVAPDFTFGTGVGDSRALRDERGSRVVLLVLFSLPGSLDRLDALGRMYPFLRLVGGELLAVPLTPAPHLYRQLGPRPLVYPFVADGAAEVAEAYRLLLAPSEGKRPGPEVAHAELLIDRQGYIRARWTPGEPDGWDAPQRLVDAVRQLASERVSAPPALEHVH